MGPSMCSAYPSAGIGRTRAPRQGQTATVNASTGGYTAISSTRGRLLGPTATRPVSNVCEPQAEDAASCAQHQALDEQLSHDSRRDRAERGAHAELLPPCVRPHEDEVRDVGAGDQQHCADRTHEHPQRVRDAADQIVLQRANDRDDSPVRDRFLVSRCRARAAMREAISATCARGRRAPQQP